MKRTAKGKFGYTLSHRKWQIMKTCLYTALALAIFLAGWITTKKTVFAANAEFTGNITIAVKTAKTTDNTCFIELFSDKQEFIEKSSCLSVNRHCFLRLRFQRL